LREANLGVCSCRPPNRSLVAQQAPFNVLSVADSFEEGRRLMNPFGCTFEQ